jgi:hypothetical protein
MNEPLDLRAIEARLRVLDSDPQGTLTLAEEKALLAALRETRAALGRMLELCNCDATVPFTRTHDEPEDQAIAVLASVQDGGPPSEGLQT